MTDSASLLETFKFLENAAAEFSDEEEEDDIDGRERTVMDTSTVGWKQIGIMKVVPKEHLVIHLLKTLIAKHLETDQWKHLRIAVQIFLQ